MYKEEKTPINVIGKVLKTKEIEEIQETIKSQIDVEISFDTPKDLGLHGIKKTFEKNIESSETKFYKGSLRSRTKNRIRRQCSTNRRPKRRSRNNSRRKHSCYRSIKRLSARWSQGQ